MAYPAPYQLCIPFVSFFPWSTPTSMFPYFSAQSSIYSLPDRPDQMFSDASRITRATLNPSKSHPFNFRLQKSSLLRALYPLSHASPFQPAQISPQHQPFRISDISAHSFVAESPSIRPLPPFPILKPSPPPRVSRHRSLTCSHPSHSACSPPSDPPGSLTPPPPMVYLDALRYGRAGQEVCCNRRIYMS